MVVVGSEVKKTVLRGGALEVVGDSDEAGWGVVSLDGRDLRGTGYFIY